ncbi:Zinc finger CCCH domain-containing protein 4 [Acipenser ruthenus]|uniref:Zinc finger CCCH domain-containing protein 4 n=1 Tax=Acipenser ruthenus TaxID=7906 RepID=A0A662YQC8_ACIRT|nr:Zinc finger CCCH domain-containing protein 4 [Acipenser ruthenus]
MINTHRFCAPRPHRRIVNVFREHQELEEGELEDDGGEVESPKAGEPQEKAGGRGRERERHGSGSEDDKSHRRKRRGGRRRDENPNTKWRHASSSDEHSEFSDESDYSPGEKGLRKYREYSPQYPPQALQPHPGYLPPPHGGPMPKKGSYMKLEKPGGYGGYDKYEEENFEGGGGEEEMGDEDYDDFTKELNQYRKAKEGTGGNRGRGGKGRGKNQRGRVGRGGGMRGRGGRGGGPRGRGRGKMGGENEDGDGMYCEEREDCGPRRNDQDKSHQQVSDKKGKVICKYYVEGRCTWLFHTTGSCVNGDECMFSHENLSEDTQDLLNKLLAEDAEAGAEDEKEVEELKKQGINPLPKPPPGVGLLPTPPRPPPSDPSSPGGGPCDSPGGSGPGSAPCPVPGGPGGGPCPGLAPPPGPPPPQPMPPPQPCLNNMQKKIPSLFEIRVQPTGQLAQKLGVR